MKRMISWILTLVLVLSLFAGCGAPANNAEPTNAPDAAPTVTDPVVVADENLANTIDYLKAYYKNVKDGDLTPADFERLGTVRVGTTAYEVVYTVDCDESIVKIVKGDNGMVTIDVNEEVEEEVTYTLTATITGTDGQTVSKSWTHVIPAAMNSDEIVDTAYALEDGDALGYESTLTGEIINIDTPYSADYKNITVTIKVTGREDKPIMCYRLKGEGADALAVGDIITVTGTLKNYKGTIEFDAGCLLEKVEKGANSVEVPTDPNEILKAAFALDYGEYLPYPVTLTGKIVGAGKFSQQYGNITVTMKTGDAYLVKCFRLKGEGADKLWLDDEITVTGNVMNYNGTIEFDAGCQLVSWIDNPRPTAPEDPAKIVADAFKLGNYETLPYYCTLTGEVTKIVSKWNASNRYITINMNIEGKTIQAYKLTGDGIEGVKEGDIVSVWGMLKNYRGTIEFDSGCKLMIDEAEIVDDLYELEAGETMEGEQILTGVVTSVDTAYSSQYKNVTVTMAVEGNSEKPVQCYRLKGTGADRIKVGDTITVRGELTNYKGKYEFNSGCVLVSYANSTLPHVDASNTQAEIVEAAKQLGTDDLLYRFILTGVITSVDEAYSERYGNITVTMTVEGTPIKCYRMDGEGIEKLGVGDVISVSGNLVNYNGSVQFAQYCTVIDYTLADKSEEPEIPEEPEVPEVELTGLAKDVAAAKELGKGGTLAYVTTVTGTIVDDPTASSYTEGSWKFTVSDGTASVLCYYVPVAGGTPTKGATVTVSGYLTNYDGNTIEFTSAASATLAGGSESEKEPAEEVKPEEVTPEEVKPEEVKPEEVKPEDTTDEAVKPEDVVVPMG